MNNRGPPPNLTKFPKKALLSRWALLYKRVLSPTEALLFTQTVLPANVFFKNQKFCI